jgi:preprotein translocase subunit SecG
MAYTLLAIVHVLVCLFLIIVVLLQSGKAADLAGAFGGMGSQTAFGPRGSATLLSKATTASAILFMITSLSLSIVATRRAGVGNTILEKHPGPASTKQPAPSPAPATQTPGAPVTVNPGAPAQPGQPSVTLTDPKTGESKTMPLTLPPPPGQQQPAPAKK